MGFFDMKMYALKNIYTGFILRIRKEEDQIILSESEFDQPYVANNSVYPQHITINAPRSFGDLDLPCNSDNIDLGNYIIVELKSVTDW